MNQKKASHNAIQEAVQQSIETRFETAFALHRQGQIAAAQAIYQEILKTEPTHFRSLQYSGVAAYQNGNLAESVDFYAQALAVRDDDAELYSHLGLVLSKLQEYDAAIESFEKALALKPDFANAWVNLGDALMSTNRLEESLTCCDKAIQYDPDSAIAHNNRGNVFKKMKHFAEAIESYDRALAINSNYAEAWHNLGFVFSETNRLKEAHGCFERALALNPHMPETLYGNAAALASLEQYDAALENYHKALAIKPDLRSLFAEYFFLKAQLCMWDSYQEHVETLESLIRSGVPVSNPFHAIALSESPEIHKLATRRYLQDEGYLDRQPIPMAKLPRHEKIRVGYYSTDFRRHAVGHLVTDLFEAHDREKFDFYAFSFGHDDDSQTRRRIKAAFGDRFLDVSHLSNQQIIDLSRQLEIDIALDMNGFTKGSRVEIFLTRVAPLQMNYLGFPGSMVAGYIDYAFSDKTFWAAGPAELTAHAANNPNAWTEKFAILPRDVFPARCSPEPSCRPMGRAEFGLPEEGFVFCSFNGAYKIRPQVFDCWMRLMKAVEGSVLWLLLRNDRTEENLRREAEARGVRGERIIFAPWLPHEEHLALHRLADLFLDTWPYNASTTANDALWAGLPVLTQTRGAAVGTNAARQLKAIGMPEMIVGSEAQYEALALELANNPVRLRALKEKLAANRFTTPLFEVPGYARAIEAAYRMMYERYQADLPPDHFEVVID